MTDETKQLSSFERLAAQNVNDQVEKKGGLSYLSWAWAVDRLLRADPEAKWSYGEMVYLADRTALVYCTVKAFGIERTMQLPVMDYKNRAIKEPDAFAINTAMQRCLVKAIALHGLGLYIYAGEDLPPGEEPPKGEKEVAALERTPDPNRPNTARQSTVDAFDLMSDEEKDFLNGHAKQMIKTHAAGGDIKTYYEAQKFDNDEKMALYSLLPPAVRAALKREPLGSQP